jgi:hypothetical protein
MSKMSTLDIYFDYLDGLRESGVVNMYGASEYLQRDWDLSRTEAREVLKEWMESFATRHPKGE